LKSLSSSVAQMATQVRAARFRIISVVIVAVLGLQVFAVVARSGKWTWPFTDYPMYAQSHQEGERIPAKHFVFARTADGREVEVTPENLGVNRWVFERWASSLKRAAAQQRHSDPSGRAVADRPARAKVDTWPVKVWLKSTWLFGLFKSKPDPDLAPLFLEHLQAKQGLEIVRLRIEDTPVALSRAGPIPAPPQIVELELPLRPDK
jgi:hypothetical protein